MDAGNSNSSGGIIDDEDETMMMAMMEEQTQLEIQQHEMEMAEMSDMHDELEALREMEMEMDAKAVKDIFVSHPEVAGCTGIQARMFEDKDETNESQLKTTIPSNTSSKLAKIATPHHRNDYSSSPPCFTSPLSRADQPMPIPSDWSIISRRTAINSDPITPKPTNTFATPAPARTMKSHNGGVLVASSDDEADDYPYPRARLGQTSSELNEGSVSGYGYASDLCGHDVGDSMGGNSQEDLTIPPDNGMMDMDTQFVPPLFMSQASGLTQGSFASEEEDDLGTGRLQDVEELGTMTVMGASDDDDTGGVPLDTQVVGSPEKKVQSPPKKKVRDADALFSDSDDDDDLAKFVASSKSVLSGGIGIGAGIKEAGAGVSAKSGSLTSKTVSISRNLDDDDYDRPPQHQFYNPADDDDDFFSGIPDDDMDEPMEDEEESKRRAEIRYGKQKQQVVDSLTQQTNSARGVNDSMGLTQSSLLSPPSDDDDDDDDELLRLPSQRGLCVQNEYSSSAAKRSRNEENDEAGDVDGARDGGDGVDDGEGIQEPPKEKVRLSWAAKQEKARKRLAQIAKEVKGYANMRRKTQGHLSGNGTGYVHLDVKNYDIMPIDGRMWVTAITSSGKKLYFPKRRQWEINVIAGSDGNADGGYSSRRQDLLGVNIHVMMRQLEDEMKIREIEEEVVTEVGSGNIEIGNKDADITVVEDGKKHNTKATSKLWVEKYAPRAYIDLVGDERLNREVLLWVKQWDYCVFKKVGKKTAPQPKWGQKENMDPLRRPEKKILLMAGPAGLGKTTLAHIVSKHCGYNIIEINASDDRTGEALRNKLLGAIEAQSIANSKPNLIIIDEIDGASQAGGDSSFMKLLVDLANGELKVKGGSGSGGGDQGAEEQPQDKRVSANTTILDKPLTTLASNRYAPVLRPLRNVAETIIFGNPNLKILARRMTEICRWEGLSADLRTIMALCELTDGDMRSSLNTLQFIRRKTTTLTYDMLFGMDFGQKDMSRGLFKVWEAIFTLPNARQAKKIGFGTGDEESRNGSGFDGVSIGAGGPGGERDTNRYVNRLLSIIVASGEDEKVLQGCFDNYLNINILDNGVSSIRGGDSKIEQIMDWLVFYDRVDHRILADHDFELMRYRPYALVNFHRLFATVAKPKITFPRADYDNYLKLKVNEGFITTFLSGLSSTERFSWASKQRIIQELIHHLLSILSPDLRRQVTATLRQLISKEIQLEVIRRAEAVAATRKEKSGSSNSLVKYFQGTAKQGEKRPGLDKENQADEVMSENSKRQKPAIVTALIPKAVIQPTKSVARDFFGRPISVDDKNPNVKVTAKPRIVFKHNEGFSNAVRKPVKMRDFF
ncbi:hypothetical protein HDU76_012758 [Blyttiomyces sp. JEL0837]|nr:hypothetical protein HDU76_012758 [Blyttiomyces sp. JEL0837]